MRARSWSSWFVFTPVVRFTALAATVFSTATCALESLTAPESDLALSIAADTALIVGETVTIATLTSGGAPVVGVRIRYSSESPSIIRVDSVSGEMTALLDGVAVVRARADAPSLPPGGVTASVSVRARYAGVAIDPIDSLTGLGQMVTPVVRGLGVSGAPAGIVTATLTVSDTTVLRRNGNQFFARANGTTNIVATYGTLTATRAVRVRRVAKSVSAAAQPFVFTAIGRDTNLIVVVRDTRDSIIASPALVVQSLDAAAIQVGAGNVLRSLRTGTSTVRVSVDTASLTVSTSVSQVPTQLVKLSGDAQTGVVGSALPESLSVQVRDAGGTSIAGASVAFSLGSGGGSVQTATSVADAQGRAFAGAWTLGTVPGTATLSAAVGAAVTSFSATAQPGAAASLVLSASPISGSAGQVLTPIQVTLRDQFGNIATLATATVSLTVSEGTLSGTTSRVATAGIAHFNDIVFGRPASQIRLSAQATGVSNAVLSGPFNVVGAPFRLRFSSQPTSIVANAPFAPGVTVAIEDSIGNALPAATNQVTLTRGAGGDSSAVLLGGLTSNAVAGSVTFGTATLQRAGTGYTLVASATGLASATSNPFNVSAGTASRLEYRVQPTTIGPNVPITPAPQVAVTDAFGNQTTSSVSVAMAFGANATGATLSGTTSTTSASGLATFSNLRLNTVGSGYTLVAASAGLTSATSDTFRVLGPGTPRALIFSTQPSTATAGVANPASITVRVIDSVGVTVSSSSASVTLEFADNPNAGTLSGTLTRSAVNGVATFTDVRVNRSGTGTTLRAISAGLTPDTSAAFAVVPGAISNLAWQVQPDSGIAGEAMSPAPVVAWRDGQGNVVSSATDTIVVSLSGQPGNATLTGTLRVAAVNGVATFSNLVLDRAYTSYSLRAASVSNSPAALSSSFVIVGGAPAGVELTSEPALRAVNADLPTISARVVDAFGNLAAGSTNEVSLTLATNTFNAALGGTTTRSAANGSVSFNSLSVALPGRDLRIVATSPLLAPDTSAVFNIYGAPHSISFSTQPVNGIRNAILAPSVVLQVLDSVGNLALGASGSATISLAVNTNAGSLSGTLSRGFSSGVATFDNLRVDSAGIGYRLGASFSSLPTVQSSTFNLAAFGTATQLRVLDQPASADVDSIIRPAVQVAILDAVQNRVTNSTASVTIALGSNSGSGTLNGTRTKAAVNGVATFDSLSVSAAGTVTLAASSAGLTATATSAFGIVNPGQPVRFVFDVQPSNQVAGNIMVPAVRVCAVNSAGALTPSYSSSITLSVRSGPLSGSITGTTSAVAGSGCATFSNISFRKVGVYSLRAAQGGLLGESATFTVTHGFAHHLAYTAAPSIVVAGDTITTPVTVEVRDEFGNTVENAANNITICYGTSYPQSSCLTPTYLDGNVTETAINGVANFSGLRVRLGTNYQTFTAFSGALSTYEYSTSRNEYIEGYTLPTFRPGSPYTLYIDPTHPRSNQGALVVIAREAIPTFVVEVRDSLGNNAAAWNLPVVIALNSNPTGASLNGVTARLPASGYYASFSGVGIDRVGTGYTVVASSAGLVSAETAPFNAVSRTASSLRFATQPASAAVGAAISPAIRVQVEDELGNTVTSSFGTITLAIQTNPGGATLGGTLTVNVVNGVAQFPNITLSAAGTGYTLRATTNISGVTGTFVSQSFNITP